MKDNTNDPDNNLMHSLVSPQSTSEAEQAQTYRGCEIKQSKDGKWSAVHNYEGGMTAINHCATVEECKSRIDRSIKDVAERNADTDNRLNECAEQIVTAHKTILECNRLSEESGRKAIDAAIRAGTYLNEVKRTVKHGGFLKWLEANCSGICEKTAENYMRLANPNHVTDLTDCSSLRQAYIATGIIKKTKDAPATENGSSSGNGDKFSRASKAINRLATLLTTCNDTHADRMMSMLTPIVHWYNERIQQKQKREAALNDGFDMKEAA